MSNKKIKGIDKILLNDSNGRKYIFINPHVDGSYSELIINNKKIFPGENIKIILDGDKLFGINSTFLSGDNIFFRIIKIDTDERFLCIDGKFFKESKKNELEEFREIMEKKFKNDKNLGIIYHKIESICFGRYNYYNGVGYLKIDIDKNLNLKVFFNDELISENILENTFGKDKKSFFQKGSLINFHYDHLNKDLYSIWNLNGKIKSFKNGESFEIDLLLGKGISAIFKDKLNDNNKVVNTIKVNNFYYKNNNLFCKIEYCISDGLSSNIDILKDKEIIFSYITSNDLSSKHLIDNNTGNLHSIIYNQYGRFEYFFNNKPDSVLSKKNFNIGYNDYTHVIGNNLHVIKDINGKLIFFKKTKYEPLKKICSINIGKDFFKVSYNNIERKYYISYGNIFEGKMLKMNNNGKINEIDIKSYIDNIKIMKNKKLR